jgi:polygalacturonase
MRRVRLLPVLVFTILFLGQIKAQTGWDTAAVILKSIVPPTFPAISLNIVSFGAVGDSVTDCSTAIKAAIDSVNKLGGGKVIVPSGVFLTGPVYLKSNVNLYIAKGGRLLFSSDKTKFLPVVYTRFEGTECMNYSPFIYAYGESNIALTGSGTIDGQGNSTSNWWDWKYLTAATTDANNLITMASSGTAVANRVFGSGHYLRPNFVQFYSCKNILVDSITILRSPMWEIHPVLCDNVTVSNITVNSHGPNNDGCNPECSSNVLIKNCSFDTGDDCIAIKAGKNDDGRRVNTPSRNIIVKKCKFADGHGGVTMGSEMTGGIRNVFADSCTMNSTNFYCMLRFKTNTARGGTIENIYMKNSTATAVTNGAIYIEMTYNSETGSYTPTIRNIYVDSISCSSGPYAVYIKDLKASPVNNINISNSIFTNISSSNVYGYATGIHISNVKVNGAIISGLHDEQSSVEKSFVLSQNYPNPFNPSTQIQYQLVESGHVSLTIYDMLGNEIKNLDAGFKEKGSYSCQWDGTTNSFVHAASGVYLCKLQGEGIAQTIKMLLIK